MHSGAREAPPQGRRRCYARKARPCRADRRSDIGLQMARSTKSRGTGGKDPNQLHIDWTGNTRPPAPAVPPTEVPESAEARTGIADDSLPFDQHLPWDFKNTFP